MKFYVTFGQKYANEPHPKLPEAHPNNWVEVEAWGEMAARAIVHAHLGMNWAMIYDENQWDQRFYPGKCIKILATKTPTEARKERDENMATVEENAGDEWQEYAIALIRSVAKAKGRFTSDEVMEAMERKPHNTKALGPAMLQAAKLGIIRKSGDFLPSRRRHCTPIIVWESAL